MPPSTQSLSYYMLPTDLDGWWSIVKGRVELESISNLGGYSSGMEGRRAGFRAHCLFRKVGKEKSIVHIEA